MFYSSIVICFLCLERAHVCLGGGGELPGGPWGGSWGPWGGGPGPKLQGPETVVDPLVDVQKSLKTIEKMCVGAPRRVRSSCARGGLEGSWEVLGHLKGSWGGLWVVLVGSWGSWGALGGSLGGLGGVLGGSWKSPRTARSD